jgi:hypothetical protein
MRCHEVSPRSTARLERAKRDEFERHHAGLPQRQCLQKLIGFGTLRHVHDEDDPTASELFREIRCYWVGHEKTVNACGVVRLKIERGKHAD